jgi:hypothetical protein
MEQGTLFELPPEQPAKLRKRTQRRKKRRQVVSQVSFSGKPVTKPWASQLAQNAGFRTADPGFWQVRDDVDFESESCASLCLWAAIDKMLIEQYGLEPYTHEFNVRHEAHRRHIQHCRDCPGAATCERWQAILEVDKWRKHFLHSEAVEAHICPISSLAIRKALHEFRARLVPYKDANAFEIKRRLISGETVIVKGLMLTPLSQRTLRITVP